MASRSIGGVFAELTLRDLKFRSGLKRAGASLAKFGTIAVKTGAVATAALGAYLVKSVESASNLSETLSKSQAIFGANAKAMESWAGTAATSFGQSKQEALEAAATIGNMFKAMGLGEQQVTDMSKSMVELGGDLASFNNTSPEDAIQAIGAALRGESEPIRRYGVLLDDATLKAKALAMGLYAGKGSLSPATRAMAAYQVILEQTTTAQGDFAKTSDGLANSQRIMKAQLSDMTAEIGMGLLPAALDLAAALKTIDFTAFGEDISDNLTAAMDVLTNGKAWELFTLQGQLAIETLRSDFDVTSEALNGWAATLNATAETGLEGLFNGTYTQDFAANFDKYAQAGKEANEEALAGLKEKIDAINLDIAEKAAKRAAGKPGDGDSPPIELPPPSVDIPKAAKKAPKLNLPDIERNFDDYQRRGLSMSKDPGKVQDKVLKVQEQIRDILKAAQTDGQLKWAI